MNDNDIPLVAFFKQFLDPLLMVCLMYILTLINDEIFNGYYIIFSLIAYFLSTYVYDKINLYAVWRSGKVFTYVRELLFGWVIIDLLLILIGYVTNLQEQFPNYIIFEWFLIQPIVMIFFHLMIRNLASSLRKGDEIRSVVIVGAGELGKRLSRRINEDPFLFMDISGYFDDRNVSRHASGMIPLLGGLADVASYVSSQNIKIIFISLPMSAQPRILKLINELQDTTASVYFVPDVYVFDLVQARFDSINGMPLVAICETPFTGFNGILKRISDLLLSILILISILPLMLVIALAIKLTSPGGVIFKQKRYGLNGEGITVYKFRTMTVSEDGHNVIQAKKEDKRLTSIGGFLRKTSLDELPQFFNVLEGSMSIVGPRPHAVAHNEQYRKIIKGYMLRHKVKPGITGWAQVNGLRGETDTVSKMKERIDFDLDYLRNWSLSFDLWIILKTVLVVLRRENAY